MGELAAAVSPDRKSRTFETHNWRSPFEQRVKVAGGIGTRQKTLEKPCIYEKRLHARSGAGRATTRVSTKSHTFSIEVYTRVKGDCGRQAHVLHGSKLSFWMDRYTVCNSCQLRLATRASLDTPCMQHCYSHHRQIHSDCDSYSDDTSSYM